MVKKDRVSYQAEPTGVDRQSCGSPIPGKTTLWPWAVAPSRNSEHRGYQKTLYPYDGDEMTHEKQSGALLQPGPKLKGITSHS